MEVKELPVPKPVPVCTASAQVKQKFDFVLSVQQRHEKALLFLEPEAPH